MGLGIREKRGVSPGSPANAAPETAAAARAEGAPDVLEADKRAITRRRDV